MTILAALLAMSSGLVACHRSSAIDTNDTGKDSGHEDTSTVEDIADSSNVTESPDTTATDPLVDTSSETGPPDSETETGPPDSETETGPPDSETVDTGSLDTDTWNTEDSDIVDTGTADSDSDTSAHSNVTWVFISGGTFNMGSTLVPDEQPIHSVTISSFDMTKSEVTVSQYAQCVAAEACTEPSPSGSAPFNWGLPDNDNLPVNYVDWNQAVSFCKWVGGRLPSEAEWEYAARNGGQDVLYPWGDETVTCSYAVMSDGGSGCGTNATMDVCSIEAGKTIDGLCDMIGNVNEWIQDVYHSTYDGAPVDGSAWELSGSGRIVRGGSMGNDAMYCRTTNRESTSEDSFGPWLGFRCAK